MSCKRRLVPMAALFACSFNCVAFEVTTHSELSMRAYDHSTLTTAPGPLSRIRVLSNDLLPSTDRRPGRTLKSVRNLIGFGADWEDNQHPARVRNHFFNPLTGEPLLLGPLATPFTGMRRFAIGSPSPDWILEDRGPITPGVEGKQEFSFNAARYYFAAALYSPLKADRDKVEYFRFSVGTAF